MLAKFWGVESEGNVPTIGDKIVKITSENKSPHPSRAPSI